MWRLLGGLLRVALCIAGGLLGGGAFVLVPCVVSAGRLRYCYHLNGPPIELLFWGGVAAGALPTLWLLFVRRRRGAGAQAPPLDGGAGAS